MSQRQVDDIDPQSLAVGHREIDRRQDVAGVALAIGVENLQADQASAQSNADILVVRELAGAGDQPRDVRAVPVFIARWRGDAAPREVVERGNPPFEIWTR
jgi:hypothetical protein